MNNERVLKKEEYNGNGKKYEIISTVNNRGYKVTTTLNGDKVYPSYIVDWGTDFNLKENEGLSGIEKLIEIAKIDIDNNFYIK